MSSRKHHHTEPANDTTAPEQHESDPESPSPNTSVSAATKTFKALLVDMLTRYFVNTRNTPASAKEEK
jgi:hypothetical protein